MANGKHCTIPPPAPEKSRQFILNEKETMMVPGLDGNKNVWKAKSLKIGHDISGGIVRILYK